MGHLKSDSKRNFDLERKTAENLETLSTTKRGYNEEMTTLENRSTHLHMTEQQLNVEFETLTREFFDLKSLLQSNRFTWPTFKFHRKSTKSVQNLAFNSFQFKFKPRKLTFPAEFNLHQ